MATVIWRKPSDGVVASRRLLLVFDICWAFGCASYHRFQPAVGPNVSGCAVRLGSRPFLRALVENNGNSNGESNMTFAAMFSNVWSRGLSNRAARGLYLVALCCMPPVCAQQKTRSEEHTSEL